MRSLVGLLLVLCSLPALAALGGVHELRAAPEAVADRELDVLIGERVRAADVVAIGESVHGSAGFLRVQTRLVRYLVERHAVRLVVWENPTLRSRELADWVARCARGERGAPPLDVLYMPTAADAALWQWVCEFNRSHPAAPIVFRGMDVWDRPWEHYARVDALASRLAAGAKPAAAVRASCPGYAARSWEAVDGLLDAARAAGGFQPPEAYRACRAALTELMEAARAAGRQAEGVGAEDTFELSLTASTLLGWLGFYQYDGADDVLGWNERDRAQGRNLALLMEKHRAARAVLVAHTSHVSHNRSPANWWGYGDLKSGVHFFQAQTGRKVFAIALTAYRATGTQGDWLLPEAANSLDRRLHGAGHAFAFFSAAADFLAEHPRWWMQNGNADRFPDGVEIVPRDHFDAWFYLRESLLDRALPARPMWRP